MAKVVLVVPIEELAPDEVPCEPPMRVIEDSRRAARRLWAEVVHTIQAGQMSAHFSWAEVTRSPTARAHDIDNSVPEELKPNIERTMQEMESVRSLLEVPILITSWYRCPELNRLIGGSSTSAHMRGLAVDFKPAPVFSLVAAFEMIAASPIQFDQLIHERTRSGADWIHLGFTNGIPRLQIMRAMGETLGSAMTFTRVAPG